MDLPLLLISGAVAGTLAGLLGIGGGIIIVPIVTLLFETQGLAHGFAIKMALGTSLATIVVTALSSIYTHHRKGAVEWGLFRIMTPGVLLGSLIGAWLADIIPGEILYGAFILFMFAVSAQMALSRVSAHGTLPGSLGLTGVSTGVGIISALMGIGGGSLNVPFFSFCGVPIKRSIATAAAVGLPISVSATIGYGIGGLNEAGLPPLSLGYVNLPVFGGVVAASLLFAPLGATLAHKLPDQLLRRLFAIFLFVLASRMSFKLFLKDPTSMRSANLYTLFQRRFPNDPEALFLDGVDGRRLRYSEVPKRTGRMLSLLQQLGVQKGDRVVVQVDKSIEAVLLYLACLRAGAIYIPLNTAYTPTEVAYFLRDATPRVFLCTPAKKAELEAIAKDCGVSTVLNLGGAGDGELIAALEAQPASEDIVQVEPDELASILYTSGTTGLSKGAMLSHANLTSNASVLFDTWHWQQDDVLLHALPIFHVHGLFVALHCALLGGSRVIFLPQFDADAVLRTLPEATVMMGVPTFYTRLLEHEDFGRETCAGMRLLISGSAPLLAETHREFEARTGHRILERYGMTEAGMITSNPYDGERVAGTVGYPLPGIRVRVADDRGNELPRGEAGVFEITGPNVFKGYWQMPEKTAEEFRDDGWFITGDIAVMSEDGRVTIVGRAKDLIISGGFNVYPKEIESAIDDLPGVKESAVIGVPHLDFGEAVAAVVVPNGSTEITEQSVVAALSDRLARFKQPKRAFIVDELPRNSMGKVQKNVLRDTYKGTFA